MSEKISLDSSAVYNIISMKNITLQLLIVEMLLPVSIRITVGVISGQPVLLG